MISSFFLTVILVCPLEGPNPDRTIDSILSKRYLTELINPTPLCDDSIFLRRISLDLIGRIPSIEELNAFLAEPNRVKKVDELLDSAEFDRFVSEVWTAWLIGYSNAYGIDREVFRIWLEKQIANEVSFKKIVQQIISAEGSVAIDGPTNFMARHYDQPAVTVCRSFLGVRLECAQCHDHPFDRWTQNDFELMNRFFQPLRRQQLSGTIVLRDTPGNENQKPKFLTGAVPRTGSYRQELSLYVTSCKPFARNFANRIWYQLMGQGIVDPPDDFNQENPPVDRELLDFVSQRVTESDFHIKLLFRDICLSNTYQRASANRGRTDEEIALFAARKIKPLLAEQFINSVSIALDRPLEEAQRADMIRRLIGGPQLNEDYQRTWQYRETVQQLMHKITYKVPDLNLNVDEIYRRVLTREPTNREKEICRETSSSDILYALVFGNEFFFNH